MGATCHQQNKELLLTLVEFSHLLFMVKNIECQNVINLLSNRYLIRHIFKWRLVLKTFEVRMAEEK